MIRVMIVDDQSMVCGALATLLNLEPDIEVCAQANDGETAIIEVEKFQKLGRPIDVVVMDIEMAKLDGISACQQISETCPATNVLIVTTFSRPGYVQRALESGATGYLVKDTPSEQLAVSVRKVSKGERVIDPQLAIETLTRGNSPLTERETEVLREASHGGTVTDIAQVLRLSPGTVRNYISSAMWKTASRTRAEAVKVATESGWL